MQFSPVNPRLNRNIVLLYDTLGRSKPLNIILIVLEVMKMIVVLVLLKMLFPRLLLIFAVILKILFIMQMILILSDPRSEGVIAPKINY